MSKNNLRNIVIDDLQFKWIVDVKDNGTYLRVFIQPSKECIINKQILNEKLPITPSLVKNEIMSNLYGCEGGNHDIVPMLGYENSFIGEECRQCGAKFNNRGERIN